MRETEIPASWQIALRVWWSINWRAMLWGLIGGGAMKLALRFVNGADERMALILMAVSAVFCLLMEVWLIWRALTHHYGAFRLAILKRDSLSDDSTPL